MNTTITEVAPGDLLTDRNVREDLQLNKEFVASVKDHGVLVPIVAVKTDDGLRVRFGHRRTAAAVQAGRATVPVVVVESTTDGDDEAVERLLTQHAENTHRSGLTTTEDAKVAQQLSLLGLSATQIARRTHTKKAQVEAGIKLAESELATKATERYDLTLEQAVTVAEFEDDPEVAKALIVAAQKGQFEHVAQRARQDRERAQAQAPVIAALAEQGIDVVQRPGHSDPGEVVAWLRDSTGERLDPVAHGQCPGHAVYLHEVEIYTEPDGTVLDADRWGNVDWPEGKEPADDAEAEARWEAVTVTTEWQPQAVCIDPAANGHLTDSQWWDKQGRAGKSAADKTDAQREAEKKARKLVIENNKAWKAAREVRQQWLAKYLTRKSPPTGAGEFLAVTLTRHSGVANSTGGNNLAAEWFGAKRADYGSSTELAKLADKANDKRAMVIALGVILAGYESDHCTDNAWRSDGTANATGRYLRYLQTLGYTVSDVEEFAASKKTA
jgi:ParB family chromosome partitioning protein